MNQTEFFQTLRESLGSNRNYTFGVNNNNTITGVIKAGPNRGVEVNPVTAFVYQQTGNLHKNNKKETLKAGRTVGLTTKFVDQLYSATTASSNRGNAQVVRGKIRSALGV